MIMKTKSVLELEEMSFEELEEIDDFLYFYRKKVEAVIAYKKQLYRENDTD